MLPRPPRMPAVMAGGNPQTAQLYARVLDIFEQGLAKQGLPANDVARFHRGVHGRQAGHVRSADHLERMIAAQAQQIPMMFKKR